MASFLEQISGSSSIPQSVKTQLANTVSKSNSSSVTNNSSKNVAVNQPSVISSYTLPSSMSPSTASSVNAASVGLDNDTYQAYLDIANQNYAYNAEQAQINRDFQAEQAELANSFSAKEAQKNRDFQLEMSNTSYQRAVEDLKKAGLNPILAYSNGGASTTSGATAQAHSASGSQASSNDSTLLNLINSNLNREVQVKIAKIQADSAKQVAEINSNSTKYGFWSNFIEEILGGSTPGAKLNEIFNTAKETYSNIVNNKDKIYKAGSGSSYTGSGNS